MILEDNWPRDARRLDTVNYVCRGSLIKTFSKTSFQRQVSSAFISTDTISTRRGVNRSFYRLKILAKDSSTLDSDVRAVLGELLRHTELNIDLGLTACRCLNNSGRYDTCDWGLKELLSRFTGSRHVGRVHAERLQAAVQRLPADDAVDFTDKFLDDNDVIIALDDEARKGVQLLLWEQAAKCHEAGKMDLCLSWYDQSLRLFLFGKSIGDIKKSKESSENVAKLHRNRAGCLLSLGRLAEADDAARKALDFNEDCLLSHFTTFQVAIARGDQTEAIKATSRLMDKNDETVLGEKGDVIDTRHALICLAAQHSLEKGQREVAVATLYHLATSGKHDLSKLTAYRCLVRLYLTMCDTIEDDSSKEKDLKNNEEMDEVPMEESGFSNSLPKDRSSLMDAAIQRVNDAFQVLVHLREKMKAACAEKCMDDTNALVLPGNEKEAIDEQQFANEVTWFMKITWNMALQFNDNPSTMKKLFYLCKELLDLLDSDQGVLVRQKTCLLMCAACGLEVARNCGFKNQRTELEEVVRILTGCRSICGLLAGIQGSENPRKEDKSPTLLALYHFEALAKLTKFSQNSEPRELEDLFNEIRHLQHADAKTFETVAALSMESPAYHPEICKMALKLSLKSLNIQLGSDTSQDVITEIFKRKSALYRSLIETCLKESSSSDPSSKEECRTYFNEVYQIVQNSNRTFPEVDKLWFSIRCWNVGIRLFTAGHVIEAEKWCSLSLRLLSQLERFKESYESHMNLVYQEILAKKDVRKSRIISE